MGNKKRGLLATLEGFTSSPAAVVVATVAKAPESHPSLGFLVDLTIQPSGTFVQARLLFLGTRPNGGSLDPVAVGDEVLVFFPVLDGTPDPNKAIAIAGLNSAKVPLPAAFDNSQPERIHPDGYNFRALQADAVAAVVREDHLDDFGTWLGAFDVFLTATAGAATAAIIAAAAVTMKATLTTAFGSPNGFTLRVKNTAGVGSDYRSTGIQSS